MFGRILSPKLDKNRSIFKTVLVDGNNSGSTRVYNAVNNLRYGGMVWHSQRDGTATNTKNIIVDSVRGAGNAIFSHSTSAQQNSTNYTPQFYKDGFSTSFLPGTIAQNYVEWNFRCAKRFFDIVQYTGDGTNGRKISHSLGIKPGMVIIKSLNGSAGWSVGHIGNRYSDDTMQYSFRLDLDQESGGANTQTGGFISNATATDFTLNTTQGNTETNAINRNYIAYVFAHDPNASGAIQCGMYTGNGTAGNDNGVRIISTPWRPQWVMIKRVFRRETGNMLSWHIWDDKRRVSNQINGGRPITTYTLKPNQSTDESAFYYLSFNANGFGLEDGNLSFNKSNEDYAWVAIRADI